MLVALSPLVDTLLVIEGIYTGEEGDIPVYMAAASGDTMFVSSGRDVFPFYLVDGAVRPGTPWKSPVAFDDILLWNGRLYALCRGEERVYIFTLEGRPVDSVVVPWRYMEQSLYLFAMSGGVYVELVGDSSYSITGAGAVPDPVPIGFASGKNRRLVVGYGAKRYPLPGDVVSASFIGQDGEGNLYLLLEKDSASAIWMGMGLLGPDGIRVEWLGKFSMEGYMPQVARVSPDGRLFLFIPADSGLRVIVFRP